MTEAPTYPAHWEADVVLRDGGTAHLRPIGPEDAELLQEFYADVSPQSKYYRFFAAMPTLSEREVRRFVDVDHHDRVALVAEVGEKMIAVGQFERLDGSGPSRAEIAFLVQDRHHHRGLGQLLLEHLAQIGREVGVDEFVAEVLPDNTGMLQVFRDAGYQVKGGFEDGVVAMRFPIDATETSVGVMVSREHRADTASVQHFLGARSVAVIGASRREDTVGRTLVRNIVLGDFQGRVYVVNPAADSVAGMPAYASVSDIPDEVEIAVIAVPAEAVPDVILDCAHKGVRGVVVVSAGFAESGREGRALQRRVLRLCRTYGLRLIGPNCLGVINTATDLQLNASLSPVMPPRGRAGFFCQSGALGVAILENVSRRGLGLSTFVSAGNRADVSGNDLLQYWEEDDPTEVVLLYLESLGNPRKFSRISRRVSRRKPVIVVKSGRTTQGIPMGHAVRSSEIGPAAVDAMFRQAGVIQVDSIDEMFDVAQLVAHQPLPRGRRLGVVSNSDALALLANDAAVASGLQARWVGDLGPDADADAFEHALDEAIDDPEIDAVLAVYLPPIDTSGREVANVLAVVGEQSDKPVVSSFLAAEGVPELLRVPDATGSSAGRGSVPSYSSPAAAVVAMARAAEYAEWLARPEVDPEPGEEVDLAGGRATVTRVLMSASEGRDLTDDEVHELLAAYGIDLWRRVPVADEEGAVAAGAELGWDVILKSTAEHLRQRPDLAHVWRNIDTEDEMRDAWRTMRASIGDGGEDPAFVVQRVAPTGVPLSVRGLEDPLFGPVVSFGMSGWVTDLLGDQVFRIPPLAHRDAAEMVREIKAAPLLLGYRGSEPVDLAAVEDLVLRVARIKNDLPEVRSLDLSLVMAGSHGASVLSAAARVEPASDARSDWFVRRLSEPVADTLPGVRSETWDRLLLGRFDPVMRRYFTGVALSALGSGLTLPFLFVYLAKVRDLPTPTVGLVLAGMGLVGLLTTPLCGTLVDRLGPRPVLVGAVLLEALGTALLSQVETVRGAFLVTGVIALGHAWMWPAASSMIPRMVAPELREHVFGLSFMLMNAGLGVGGLLSATLVDTDRPGTFEVLYLLDSLTFLGFAAIVLSLPRTTGRAPDPGDRGGSSTLTIGGWREVLADSTLRRVAATMLLLLTFGYAQMESGFAAYVVEVARLPEWVLGPAFAANTAAIVAGQLFALRVVQGRRRSRVLATVALVWAAAWTLVAASGVLPPVAAGVCAVVGLAVFGIGETLFSPVHPALVNDLAPERLRGRYNALGSSTWTIAMVLGPAIAGLLIGHGLALLWVVATVGGSLTAAVLLLRLRPHLTDAQDGLPAVGETPADLRR